MKYAKIVDHNSLVRDLHSKAVLNTDLSAVRKHEKRVADLQKEDNRNLEMISIKAELGEIRSILRELLQK